MPTAPATKASSRAGRRLRQRSRGIEAVVHNQDNREHDLLDSDDYYQFEGGMTRGGRASLRAAAGDLSQRPFAPRAPGRPRAGRGDRPRRARPRRQPEMDRRRHAPRLQGRLRDGRDGRLPVRLRRDDGRGARSSFRLRLRRLIARRRGARLHRGAQSGGACARWPSASSRRSTAACGRRDPIRRSSSSPSWQTASTGR